MPDHHTRTGPLCPCCGESARATATVEKADGTVREVWRHESHSCERVTERRERVEAELRVLE